MNPLPDDASKDQYGEIPQGYYRRNTGMLHMLPTAPQSPANAPLFIPNMDDEQLRKLAREKLSQALQAIDPVTQPGMTKALCAEVKDRLDGKAIQAINQTSTIAMLVQSVQPDVELLKRIKNDLLNGLVIDN